MSRKRTNPRRIPASRADIERCKAEVAVKAVEDVYAVFFSACWDGMGFTKEQMQELWNHVQNVADTVQRGYATIPQLMWTLRHEAGIVLDGRKFFG